MRMGLKLGHNLSGIIRLGGQNGCPDEDGTETALLEVETIRHLKLIVKCHDIGYPSLMVKSFITSVTQMGNRCLKRKSL